MSPASEGYVYFGTPYDAKSILQVGKFYSSKHGDDGKRKQTFQLRGKPDEVLGNDDLSKWDIVELNMMYQCKKGKISLI